MDTTPELMWTVRRDACGHYRYLCVFKKLEAHSDIDL